MSLAIARRRLADDLAERPAEGPQAHEADVEADVGDAAVGFAEEEHRALYPPPLQVSVRRLSEHRAEAADEVRLGDIGHRGHGADVERQGVGAIHGVAGAQQAPVQLLGFPAHPPTLRRQEACAQRGSNVPRPWAIAFRTIASAKTRSASPTPRCATTTRPSGRFVPATIASPMVTAGSG